MITAQRATLGRAAPRRTRAPARASWRAAGALVRAQRAPPPPPSDPPALQALQALETAAVALAVGAHFAALAAQRQAQAQAQAHQGKQRVMHAAAAPAAPPPPLAAAASGWLAPGSLWLSLPLVAALALGRLRAWLTPRRCAAAWSRGCAPQGA